MNTKRNTNLRIGVVDDHPTFREGIVSTLSKKKSFDIIFTAENALDLYKFMYINRVDVLLLDINLPEVNGFDILKTLRKKYPSIRVLILSAQQDSASKLRAFKNGASGYLSKEAPVATIIMELEKVYRGEYQMDSDIKQTFEQDEDSSFVDLTDRETAILRLICKEMSSHEIGNHLGISINTVNNHRKSLLKKVGTTSIVGLLKFAFLHGYMD